MRRCVLITGASGFIGRWSVAPLLAAGFEVHAVIGPSHAAERATAGDRRAPSADLPELAGATLHAVDLLDETAAAALVDAVGATHLLAFAWIATPGIYWTHPDNARWLEASRRLLERFIARGGVRAVSAGTCAEYDWNAGGMCVESTSPLIARAAATPYAGAKIDLFGTMEQVRAAGRCSTAVGRLFFQYGPYEPRERLIASVITQLLAGREALCTHGRQVRSFLHVADVGAAFAALLDSPVEGAVNIGSADSTTLEEAIEILARRIGRADLVRLGAREPPANEPAVLLPDVTRLSVEVGWLPRFSLDGGLAATVDWWTERLRE